MDRISAPDPGTGPEHTSRATVDDLKSRELFEDVDEPTLKVISDHSFICRLGANERLHPTREKVDYIYVILNGYVSIRLTSRLISTGENFLAWRGPEQIIGEMRVIGKEPSEAKIVACEPCRLIEIRSDILTRAADTTAHIYRNIARLLMKKMYHERHRSEVIQMSPSSRKVAQALLHLAQERCGRDRNDKINKLVIPGIIHQDELGAYIGAERETVNRSLCEFKRRGLINYIKSKNGSEITIVKREELRRVAETLNLGRKSRNRPITNPRPRAGG